jgi:hypothetical protein
MVHRRDLTNARDMGGAFLDRNRDRNDSVDITTTCPMLPLADLLSYKRLYGIYALKFRAILPHDAGSVMCLQTLYIIALCPACYLSHSTSSGRCALRRGISRG